MSDKLVIISNSVEETESIAELLGKQLRGGEVVELLGDVGAGKTSFVRGLARGTDSKDRVTSPTFTVYQIYKGRVDLYHYDFYRIHEDGLIQSELKEVVAQPNATVVMEWAEHAGSVLSDEHLIIKLSPLDTNSRRLEFTVPTQCSYINLS